MPAKAFATYVVLIDYQQGLCGAGNYCVHRYGTLKAMRALAGQTHDGSAAAWPDASFDHKPIEAIVMKDPNGTDLPGEIAKLSYRQSLPAAFAVAAP